MRVTKPSIQLACAFWEKVERTETCWLWTGTKQHQGYGMLVIPRELLPKKMRDALKGTTKNKTTVATHVAWLLATGTPVPLDKFMCHHCDNPSCVRPDHLFVGDHKSNHDDMVAKGRKPPMPRRSGESNGSAKLKEADILLIREMHAQGAPRKVTMRRFKISQGHYHRIVHKISWAYL